VNLDGKVAIVTGSSSGIGEATARGLAAAGAVLVVNSSSTPDLGRSVAESLPDALYVQGDVARDEDARTLVDAALERWGRVDIVVNNAGTTEHIAHDDLESATDEVWDRILHVNVLGAWHVTRAAVAALRRDGGGSVVNVTSVSGSVPAGSSIPYAVSKAAMNHLTRLLAKALAPEIRVNAVAPGLVVDTPWNKEWIESARKAWEAVNPLGRSAVPAEVAEAVLFAATADYVTGQVITVDGGHSLL
jgi:ketoreductase RED2